MNKAVRITAALALSVGLISGSSNAEVLAASTTTTSTKVPVPDSMERKERRIKAGGEKRTYWVSAPKDAKDRELPLILAFHGKTDTAKNFLENSGLGHADAIVVAPDGLAKKDVCDDKFKQAWSPAPYAVTTSQQDFALVDALLAKMDKEFNIDPERIYLTGFSNGGGFVASVISQRPKPFAGAVIVSAAVRNSESELRTGLPVPLRIIHGDKDQQVPLEGYNRPTNVKGCKDGPGDVVLDIRDVRSAFLLRSGSTNVSYHEVKGMGHKWIHDEPIDVTDEVLDFFDIPKQG